MKKILLPTLTILTLLVSAATVSASGLEHDSDQGTRDLIKDLLYEYKDAYNLRDFDAIRSLYTKDAIIVSFPCQSKEEVLISEFSDNIPRCASLWVEGGFKVRLFKITSFKKTGDKVFIRVLWDYRDNEERGKFTPSFEFTLVDGKWKISKETYGRKVE
ncbi:YybH family protein [Maridesulfovibrio hydrothermalis]|uniref:DUF4440 domain-containing protein n=1 Tax=Maridesulfovibrio hydrothermalis AM13 = DSM 14728 TaxID=1121451 RepID=L0RH31_9BACT|nr:nuclear transport factor 2 family protein [Maridesulfovibrio hydrothermalis]CCO24886.1 conserved exported protein of unknown function [Maridesulfovibrio hydrothermalis AM13 = DSM 14728]